MKTKDYEPIKFEIFQSDMEKIMNVLNETIYHLDMHNCIVISEDVEKIKDDFQHKIDIHRERGDWI